MNTSRRALDSRKWIFATGALTGAAIALASLVILNPLTAARDDLRGAAQNVAPLEEHVGALHTALLNFQLFLERHVDAIVPGTTPTPTELANGAKLAQAQQDQEAAVANGLRDMARTSEARDLDAAMKSLGAALDKMTPIAVGVSFHPRPERGSSRANGSRSSACGTSQPRSGSTSPTTTPGPTPRPLITCVAVAPRC
jgi:hypothetical protein